MRDYTYLILAGFAGVLFGWILREIVLYWRLRRMRRRLRKVLDA